MSDSAAAPLKRGLLTAFILPTLILGVMHGPEGQIQAIYAKHAGLALTALAAATLLSKIFDAVTYPLIGYLSDRTYARRGSRKSWVIAGAIVSSIGIWGLFRPPQTQIVDAIYFGIWMSVTYLGWKLMEIPLQAWSYSLSTDYVQRTRVQAWRALAQMGGQLLFFIIPFLAMKLGYSDSTELDFRSLGLSAIICVIALPLVTLIAVSYVSSGEGVAPVAQKRFGFSEALRAIKQNKPLLRLLAAFLPVNLLAGMTGGVSYLYIDTYLQLGKQLPAIMLIALLASLIGIPFWSAMATRFERHRVWAVSLITGAMACIAFAFVSPSAMALPLAFLLYPIIMFTLVGAVIVYTMSADIVDYGLLITGEDNAGLYGAIFAFLQKSLLGISAAIALAIAGTFGFDATAASQSDAAVFGIKLTAALLPALGLIGAAAIIWNYPLNRARVAEIQTQLNDAKAH
ncbi:MAG: MFS transporter [Pseudomonadota bacterium]